MKNTILSRAGRAEPCMLRAGEPVHDWCERVAAHLLEEAVKRLHCPTANVMEDIHFIRVRTKKLRAWLQIVRPVIGKGLFNRINARLKRISGRFAGWRDDFVVTETLQKLKAPRSATKQLLSAGPINEACNSLWLLTENELEQVRALLASIRLQDIGQEAIENGLRHVYRMARRQMKLVVKHPVAHAYHRWRIRVKHLYYALQWLQAIWPERLVLMCQQLHEMQHKLGMDHDLAVLRELLEARSQELDDRVLNELVTKASERSKALRQACLDLGGRIFGLRTSEFIRLCHQHWHEGNPAASA